MNKKQIIEIAVKALGFYLLVLAIQQFVGVISGIISLLTELAVQLSTSGAAARSTANTMIKFRITTFLGNIAALFIYFHFAHYFIFTGPKLRRLIEIGCKEDG